MNAAARIARLERVAVQAAAKDPACASCAAMDLTAGTGVITHVLLLEDDEPGFHIAHCTNCATTYRGRIVERADSGLVLANVTHGELPV